MHVYPYVHFKLESSLGTSTAATRLRLRDQPLSAAARKLSRPIRRHALELELDRPGIPRGRGAGRVQRRELGGLAHPRLAWQGQTQGRLPLHTSIPQRTLPRNC